MKTLIPWSKRQMQAKQNDEYELGFPASPFSEIDRLFEKFLGSLAPRLDDDFFPSMDVKETEQAIVVSAELPGVDDKDIQITMSDQALTIRGEKKCEKEETNAGSRKVERCYGEFMRTIPMPLYLDREHADAQYKNGVLTVTLPKSPEYQKKVRTIPLKTENGGNGGVKQS